MNGKEKLLRIVLDALGDDLERAEMAFSGLSPEQLQEEYGQSGKTKAQLLEEYRRGRKEWQTAYELAATL